MQSVNYERIQLFCINVCCRALWNVPEIALCTLRRSLGPQIVIPSGRRLNTISHSSAHTVDYAHITLVHNKAACQLFGWYSHITYITYKRNIHNGRRTPRIITNINVRCYEMIPSYVCYFNRCLWHRISSFVVRTATAETLVLCCYGSWSRLRKSCQVNNCLIIKKYKFVNISRTSWWAIMCNNYAVICSGEIRIPWRTLRSVILAI